MTLSSRAAMLSVRLATASVAHASAPVTSATTPLGYSVAERATLQSLLSDGFRSSVRAQMSSSSSDTADIATVAETVGATEAEKKKFGVIQGALFSAKAELEKKASQKIKIDWSLLDDKSEYTKTLKTYYETFKAPAVDKACVEDVKKKFKELEKALKEDAATAEKEILKIDEELKKLDFELVRFTFATQYYLLRSNH